MGNSGSAERWNERKSHIPFLKQEADQFQNSTQVYKSQLSPKGTAHRNSPSLLYRDMSLSAQGCTSAPQAEVYFKLCISLGECLRGSAPLRRKFLNISEYSGSWQWKMSMQIHRRCWRKR